MLSRVCGLQKEIATFRRQKNLSQADQLFDARLLARLALLTDMTMHLNAPNVKHHGKDIPVTDMLPFRKSQTAGFGRQAVYRPL